ncbi:MAG: glycerol-3-phosphate 1-O-acyltransferase PlsY [Candidatus Omnitrophica bacterium]|nr:glycerol-3-phosphate 1-O-acyltransferase PlsY [Candidatus Omnitrophota bacterium]
MLWIIPGLVVSYLIGSVPTAYIFGRLFKNIDIRKFGSGNVGATNALRVLGKRVGFVVLFLDVLKGFLCVLIIGNILIPRVTLASREALLIILGLSCVCGHIWTVFLRFKGGKGVAASLGVLLGLSLKIAILKPILILSILTWLAVFVISRIVSVASILTALLMPAYTFLFAESKVLLLFTFLLSVFVIIRHRSNIIRVCQGKEERVTFVKK